mmetsp:Transcript_68340/g.193639  ORF Transcript_68340/g.193639 Transcript_68340/m.193639 type:complete len:579 (-) Transcript_68340:155-1891(-)
MVWFPDVLQVLLTLHLVASTTIFLLLQRYNAKHEHRFREARAVIGKPGSSLFELPAFQDKQSECPNPFENTTWRLTLYEQVKLSLLALTVFPLRALGSVLSFFGCYLVVVVLLRLRLRRAAKCAVAMTCRTLLFCAGYHRIRVIGEQAPGVAVLVSNHCTFLDGLVWLALSTPRIFAEGSNFTSAVMQAFADALDIVCFDRSGSESRKMARQAMATAASAAVEGKAPPILVFPEGTTKCLKTVITFKDGAFAPGLPVQAAVLRYTYRHCDPSWVLSGPALPMLAFKLLSQFSNQLEVEFLPVCVPSEEERREPHKFARRVQLQLAEAMRVPVTENTVEDVQLALAAAKAKLPAEVGVVGFSALKEVFSVDAKQIKQQMLVFKEMDKNGDGLVGFEGFKACFKRAFHEPSEAQTKLLRQFFHELTGHQEKLDFRKFLIGLALVNETGASTQQGTWESEPPAATSPPQFKELVDKYTGRMYTHLAFAAFAAGSDDCITWREFEELWSWLHPAGPNTPTDEGTVAEQVACSARAIFEEIGGAGIQELTFDKFTTYSERNPDFEKRLRQAFFSRIGSDLTPH